MHIHIYTYISLSLLLPLLLPLLCCTCEAGQLKLRIGDSATDNNTPNLPTNIVEFGGFDSSIMLILRGGILTPIGDFPESLSQAMLVGTMLVGRLGVHK